MTSNELIDISVDIGAALLENGRGNLPRRGIHCAHLLCLWRNGNQYLCRTNRYHRLICTWKFSSGHACSAHLPARNQSGTAGSTEYLMSGNLRNVNDLCTNPRTAGLYSPRQTISPLSFVSCHRRHRLFLYAAVSRLDSRSNMQSVYLYYPLGHYDIFAGTACNLLFTNIIGGTWSRLVQSSAGSCM